jgi:hypothetical protein
MAAPFGPPSIGGVHVRRALLLFAIVLGFAALAASLSRPRDERADREPAPPAAAPERPTISAAPEPSAPETLAFDASRDRVRKLELGLAATVEVFVAEPGQVEIPLLGLSAAADPVTPARFDVLPPDPGRYTLTFTPASGDEGRRAGTLRVVVGD